MSSVELRDVKAQVWIEIHCGFVEHHVLDELQLGEVDEYLACEGGGQTMVALVQHHCHDFAMNQGAVRSMCLHEFDNLLQVFHDLHSHHHRA